MEAIGEENVTLQNIRDSHSKNEHQLHMRQIPKPNILPYAMHNVLVNILTQPDKPFALRLLYLAY